MGYNIGKTNFFGSMQIKKLNARDYRGACEEIKRWCFAVGKSLKGLVGRWRLSTPGAWTRLSKKKAVRRCLPERLFVSRIRRLFNVNHEFFSDCVKRFR